SLAPAERIISSTPWVSQSGAQRKKVATDSIFVLRHTLMNPWLRDPVNKIDYIAQYCDHLESLLRMELANTQSSGLPG
ncbi:hypothetical protein B1A_00332, partial [mine drainage metagenome]